MTSLSAPRLLMIAPAPVLEREGKVVLDVKFVEGMRHHSSLWPGPMTCLLRRGAESITFPFEADPATLDFGLQILTPQEPITADMLRGHDVIFCTADAHDTLHIADLAGELGIRVVYSIEYTLETRLQIVRLDHSRGLARRVKSMVWNIRHEYRRRRAFRRAFGVQANGYPAYHAYAGLNPNTMLYLDNRMTPEMFATEAEMAARLDRLRSGAPLRLIHSGRLEPMKGAQDLIPVAKRLRDKGVAFTLDIYGTGSLVPDIAAAIETGALQDIVRLHEPVDFASALVPINRTAADIFLSCHRQSDPSCTYLESMGCGLATMGYDNRMWAATLKASEAGWAVPLGDTVALADGLAALDGQRDKIVTACEKALSFACLHDFDTEFRARMDHLAKAIPDR